MLENEKMNISTYKQPFNTRNLVKVTLENPPTTLGKTSLKALSYFWKILLQREKYSAEINKQTFTTYLVFRASQPLGKTCKQ